MLRFEIGNSWTRFDSDQMDSSLVEGLAYKLSITVSYYTRRKGQRHPDKKSRQICYLRQNNGNGGLRFPSGLLQTTVDFCADNEVKFEIADIRNKGNQKNMNFDLVIPKPPFSEADYLFQKDAVAKTIICSRGLLHYPTGAGKTVIMAKIIWTLDKRALVIVPSLQLLNQTFEKFQTYFGPERIGCFGGGKRQLEKDILIATEQSLYSLWKTKPDEFQESITNSFPVLFIDECHHVATAAINWSKGKDGKWVQKTNNANTWWDVVMSVNAYHKYGMTATLDEKDFNDEFVLRSATGHVISSITVSELIKRKVLCIAKVIMIEIDMPRYKVWRNIYYPVGDKAIQEEGALENNILQNNHRNQIIASIANQKVKEGNKVLVLVDKVDTQGKILFEMIPDSIFLHGKHNTSKRNEGLAEFAKGGKVLIGTIFKEGFDFPAINVLVIAGGGKSVKSLVQKIGRVLRTCEGKSHAEIFDFMDLDGSMCQRHSEGRLKVYQSEQEYEVLIEKMEQKEGSF